MRQGGLLANRIAAMLNGAAAPQARDGRLAIRAGGRVVILRPGEIDWVSAAGVPAEDYSAVLRTGADKLVTASGSGALASQDLDLAKVRVEKGLFYLDLSNFPVQQAALQEAGYVVSTENEPGGDTSLATTLILNVGRPQTGAPPKPPSAPDAKQTASPAQKKPVTTAAGAQALAPIAGNPVTPETPGSPTPAIEKTALYIRRWSAVSIRPRHTAPDIG
jgi:hypothetical protein